jgi:hypothetical protein
MAELDIGARNNLCIGSFISRGHKLWDWSLDEGKGELYQVRGEKVSVYRQDSGDHRQTRRAGIWHLDRIRRWGGGFADKVCMVDLNTNTGKATITAQAGGPSDDLAPMCFQDVLFRWGRMWMWENSKWYGKNNWISSLIQDCSCIAVKNGSYMKKLFPSIYSTLLVIECQKGGGRLWCSFSEPSKTACSYRGELVGLMAIHLLLLAVNETHPLLQGSVHIYSDCLGALEKVKSLPPSRIPAN